MPDAITVIENAELVLPKAVVRAWLAVENGVIAEVGEGRPPERGLDFGGDYLLPGLIELHTDHLESHFAPRPQVRWHPLGSVLAYDAQIASAGITTVFDSLRVGSDGPSDGVAHDLWMLADAIAIAKAEGHLRVDHLTHLRCEIASANVIEQVSSYLERHPAQLMSLMDHTPGQRQFRDLDLWKRFYSRRTSYTDAELERFMAERLELHSRCAVDQRRELVALAQARTIVLASHDDTTVGHVDESASDGVSIAEFPTTLEAARASRDAGIHVMMGGPNIVRGGSHSGNVAAEELAREGILDILSSDYVPASLLMAAFELPRRVPEVTLSDAVATVTLNPATATGLYDRGAIAVGLRADLVRVHDRGDMPVVRRVWRGGLRAN